MPNFRLSSGMSITSLLRRLSMALEPAVAALVATSSAVGQYLLVNPSGYRIVPVPESQTALLSSSCGFQWLDNDGVQRRLVETKCDGLAREIEE
jgi:hypothetical protein